MSAENASAARRGAVVLLCAVQFVDVLGVTSATTAVPEIRKGVGGTEASASLIIASYAMFFGGLLVLASLLGDRFGHRRILLTGIGMFAVVSAAGALSSSVIAVVATRALLGAAAALSVPSALRLLLAAAPEGPRRTGALALWSAAGAAAGAAGFVVGGLLTQLLDWRAVFWINAPIGVLLFAGVLLLIPVLSTGSAMQRFDVLGAVLLILAVMSLVVGTTLLEAEGTRVVGLTAIGLAVVIGTAFVLWQRRARAPLIPADAVRSPNLRAGTLVSFVNTAATSSASVLVTLELQDALGLSPLQAGLSLVWLSVAVAVGAALSRPLARRLQPNRMGALGLAAIGAGDLVLVVSAGTVAGAIAGTVVLGAGLGVASVAGTTIGTTVPARLAGVATGILNTGAQLGTAIGVAVLVVVSISTSAALAWGIAALAAGATAGWLVFRRAVPAEE
ncbi:MFS transporter [Leifsonia poae]|uniref:MFS transporter n=1 Tax=Leifsonia poae TaxID=110933 RepID=UPI0022F2581A|nr:MFS transporter [Leifsonia poae]